jgi:hypothetical protein
VLVTKHAICGARVLQECCFGPHHFQKEVPYTPQYFCCAAFFLAQYQTFIFIRKYLSESVLSYVGWLLHHRAQTVEMDMGVAIIAYNVDGLQARRNDWSQEWTLDNHFVLPIVRYIFPPPESHPPASAMAGCTTQYGIRQLLGIGLETLSLSHVTPTGYINACSIAGAEPEFGCVVFLR